MEPSLWSVPSSSTAHLTPSGWHAELSCQFESILDQVWRSERDARFLDRLDLADHRIGEHER